MKPTIANVRVDKTWRTNGGSEATCARSPLNES